MVARAFEAGKRRLDLLEPPDRLVVAVRVVLQVAKLYREVGPARIEDVHGLFQLAQEAEGQTRLVE